jgi:hypothetical protein
MGLLFIPQMTYKYVLIKFSRASRRVKWLKVDKTDVSRTVFVLRETEVGCNPVHVIYILARAQCL